MKKYSLLFLMTLLSAACWSQYRISTCQDLGLRPVEPGTRHDILRIYLETDKFPSRGCWAYHHPNGKDFVIVPDYWRPEGANPNTDRMALIKAAMDAISDSRKKYVQYGSLDNDLYYILDDIKTGVSTGETFWLINNACWMVSGVPDFEDYTEENKKFVFAHEVGHCFVMENVANLDPNYNTMNHWFDESFAEYLASEVYPTANDEWEDMPLYNLDSLYRQEYKAFPLWKYFVDKKGKGAVVPYLNSMTRHSNSTARWRHMRDTRFDKLFHDYLFDLYLRKIRDTGGGQIPRETEIELQQSAEDLIPGVPPPITLNKIEAGQLALYNLKIPAGYDLSIDKPSNSREKAFFSLISDDLEVKEWTSQIDVSGYCDQERHIFVLASHLNQRALLGTRIKYELKERIYCCEAGLVVEANPDENNLNGKFAFDYYMESNVSYEADGESESFPMNYYVNSKDGSMLLTQSWFTSAFGTYADNGMEAEAVIWFPNGQVVAYVLDKNYGQKRAITIDLNQTRNQIMGIQAMNAAELVRMGPNSGISPSPLPSMSQWQGSSSGIAINKPERSDPSQINKISAYISNESTSITSPLPNFGFLVGYIRDAANQNRNLVYQKVELPGGDFYEGHLRSIEKMCAQFNGAGYKKMTIGSSTGAIAAMTESEREAFADDQNEKQIQLMMMLNDLESCRGDARCEAEVQKRMMELEKEIQNAVFDLPENSENRGNAASEFQEEQRAIRDEMHRLQETILDQEIKCERLRRLAGATLAIESCEATLEEYKNQMRQWECRLAHLMGVADMFEDCR